MPDQSRRPWHHCRTVGHIVRASPVTAKRCAFLSHLWWLVLLLLLLLSLVTVSYLLLYDTSGVVGSVGAIAVGLEAHVADADAIVDVGSDGCC